MEPAERTEVEQRSSARALIEPIRTSRNFTVLWSGQTLSQFGDSVLWVVLPLCVYSINQSTLDMGWVMGLLMLPQVILLPFTGVLVDRISRSRLMIATETIRCLLVGTLAVLSLLHDISIPTLFVFVIIFAIMDALFQPAYSAVRAQIFTDDIRSAALSLTQVSQEFARLLGPTIGGVIAGFISVAAGFGLDAIMLCISVTTLTFIRIPKPSYERHRSSRILHGFARDLLGGVMELRKHPWLWVTIIAFTFINLASAGITSILLPWLVKVHLALSDTSYGFVNSAAGVGAIVAAFLFGRKSKHRHRGFIAYGSIILNALALLFLALSHSTFGLMLLMAVSNGAVMIFMLIWEGSLQEIIPTESYGRVASLDLFGSWTLLPVGNVITGWLATKIGGIETILIEGSLMLCVAIGVMLVPAIRKFD